MSNASLGSKLKEWRQTAAAAAANESDLPFAKEVQVELATLADEAEELSVRGSVLKTQLQQNTLDLGNIVKRADDLSTRLRGGVRWAYGTKGMKWGVRKSKVPKQGPSDEAKSAHKVLVKGTVSGPQALSNRELKSINERLQLEKKYMELSYQPSKAKQILDVLFKSGKTVNDAISFANSPAGKALQTSLESSVPRTGPAPLHLKGVPKHMKK